MGSTSSDSLAEALLRKIDPEKNVVKNLLHKNYQISDKMGDLMKEKEVRREWSRLTSQLIS